MIIVLSPAKTLDMQPVNRAHTQPRLMDDTRQLADQLRGTSRAELQDLMSISEKLADTNYQRYQDFATPFTAENAKPALLAFKGDVYQDLEAENFTEEEWELANAQIRILSGLYGLLRPSDLMQAYRLEMGTRMKNKRGKNLYEFWDCRITELLNQDLKEDGSKLLLNLASKEYFSCLQPENVGGRILNIHFKEERNGKLKIIAFNAKKARGRMAQLITKEGIRKAEPLKELVVNDYVYRADLSGGDDWVWTK